VVNHYDAQNQLTQTLTKNYKVSFTYDAEGLRTSKTVNGKKTVFVWDGDQLVMELSGSGKVQKRYIRGNDLIYADKGEGTEKRYYVADPHGNVVQLTDENGTVTKTYEYDSFGNEVNPDSKDDNPFRYCGEYYDKETEEIYLRARYYQLAVGRFLTRDTYTGEEDESLSLHLYTYCENDGVNAWDPSGHDEVIVSGGKYKESKEGYYYEFIEPAMKKINELKANGKKNIYWYIANNGWSQKDMRTFTDFAKGKATIVFFWGKTGLCNYINSDVRKKKKRKINSFTVFSHGFIGKVAFGYNYVSANPHLTLENEDIEKILPRSFSKNAYVSFYSCNTATGGKDSFANEWFGHLKKVKGHAYEGKTDYSCINVEGGAKNDVCYIWNRVWGNLKDKEYPTASLNYPTGKNIVRYENGNSYIGIGDRPLYEYRHEPIRYRIRY
ncbi:MAG: RHS repeat-associated core domain-containing protein, partial [Ruminococcus flavefaciens]|nr:RHS repeat-associated core domain-containing protein [Ruminococcus flavefaciens]